MHDGLPYGVHGGHRLQRSIWEKETEGRPQDLPELGAFYPPPVWGEQRERGGGSDRLTARKREWAALATAAWRERVLGPLRLPPPFFLCWLRFTFERAD